MIKLEREDVKRIAELPYDWGKFNNKKILISGGTGFIASFIIEVFRYRNEKYGQNIKVISLSRKEKKSDEMVTYVQSDITKEIHIDEQIDYVLHMASNTHPKQYQEDPIGTITTNVIGCDNLLKLAVKQKASKFLLTSSVEIYGQGIDEPISESYCGYIDCNNARSGYNEAKRTCEALCQAYKQKYGINVVIARLARVFGADKKRDTKAMSQFMGKSVLCEDIILKSKGNQRYSYCYVADAASGIIKVLLDGENGEAYNISDIDENKTLGDYAEYIASLSNSKVIFDIEDNESVSKATYALLDIKKIQDIGWKPSYTVRDGLKRTYDIYREIKNI